MDLIILPIEDKPVKLVFENELKTKTEKYHLTIKEVLLDVLRWNWTLRKQLTRQQIHSERGKTKRGYYDQVVNFLVKRGISKEYIDNEVSQERERWIISKPVYINTKDIKSNFGVIQFTE